MNNKKSLKNNYWKQVLLNGQRMILTILLLVVKSSVDKISPKYPNWSGENLLNKYKNLVRLFGKGTNNFLKKRESSSKSRQARRRYKIVRFIINCCNGRQQGVMAWSSIPVCIQSSNRNYILLKLTDISHRIFMKWGWGICLKSDKRSENSPCLDLIISSDQEQNPNWTRDCLVSINWSKRKKIMKSLDWIMRLARSQRKNKRKENKNKKVLSLKIKVKILWKLKKRISKSLKKNKLS